MEVKVFIVIPAYNEEKHIFEVVKGARKYGKVIVVDDGSQDATAELAREAGALVLKLSRNKGKGYAMRVGARRALELGADAVVFMDGDGQHRPEDVPKFIEGLKHSEAVVSKRVGGGRMPLIKRIGNWGIVNMFKLLFGSDPGDMLSGFRAFRKDALEKVWWKSDGYLVETEVTILSRIHHIKRSEVKIPIIYHQKGKGTGVWDGIKIGAQMVALWLRSFF